MSKMELAWSEFLKLLFPWELHRLFVRINPNTKESYELFLHDQFVDGKLTLADCLHCIAD